MAEEMTTVNTPLKAAEEVKKEKISDFHARFVQKEQYSLESAFAALGKYLSTFKNLNERFLALVGKANALQTEKLYYPVYRMEGKAEYLWITGSADSKNPVFHKEIRQVKTVAHGLPVELAIGAGEELPLKDGEKLAYKESGKKYSIKDCTRFLRAEAERTTPQKKSGIEFLEERYEISYLPVLKISIAFEGKTYLAFVNLVNGACTAEYPASEKLIAAVEKTVNLVKARRSFIFVTFLYSLFFAGLGFLKFFQGGLEKIFPAVVLAALALIELLFWGQCFAYKREKMMKKGIEKGKFPKAKYALTMSVLSAIVAVAVMVLFVVWIF